MKLHSIQQPEGAVHAPKRLGRGTSSGTGKTSGKGHKGQNARSGGGVRVNFEGGQLPLYRRLPKRGFSNYIFKTVYSVVNVSDLNRFDNGTLVTPALLLYSSHCPVVFNIEFVVFPLIFRFPLIVIE